MFAKIINSPKENKTPKWELASLVFFLLIVLFYFPIFFCGKTLTTSGSVPTVLPKGPYGNDSFHATSLADTVQSACMDEPYAALAAQELKKGNIPLWNPYNGVGAPLVGDMLTSVFYPLKILVYFLPNPLGWDVFLLTRIFLAGLFMFGFLRAVGVSFWGGVTASSAFMFVGPITFWVNAFHLNADILVPLQFWLAEKLIQRREMKFYALNSLLLALSFLGGNPQPTILSYICVSFYYIFRRAILGGTGWKSTVKLIFGSVFDFFLIALAGVGLSAFQLLPFLEMLRLGHTLHQGAGLATFPYTTLFKSLFPTMPPQTAFGIGFVISFLALVGLVYKKFFPLNIIFLLIGGFLTLKCVGFFLVHSIGGWPIFHYILFTKYAPLLIAFSACALSGFGLDILRDNLDRKRATTLTLASLIVLMFLGLPIKKLFLHPGGYWLLLITLALSVILKKRSKYKNSWIGIPLLVLAELFIPIPSDFPKRQDPYLKPPFVSYLEIVAKNSRIFALDNILCLDTSAPFNIQNLGIIATVYENRFFNFCKVIDPAFLERKDDPFRLAGQRTDAVYPDSKENSLLNLVGIKHFLTYYPFNTDSIYERQIRYENSKEGTPLSHTSTAPWLEAHFKPGNDKPMNSLYEKIYDEEIKIYKNRRAFEPARILHRVEVETKNPDNIISKMLEIDLSQTAFIEEDFDDSISWTAPAKGLAQIIEKEPQKVRIKVQSDTPGLLVLSDLYYPGWFATVNSIRRPIYRTNYFLRGVFVNSGESEVEFYYKPFSFYSGCAISFIVFGIFLFCLMYRYKKVKIIVLCMMIASFSFGIFTAKDFGVFDAKQFIKTILNRDIPPVLK